MKALISTIVLALSSLIITSTDLSAKSLKTPFTYDRSMNPNIEIELLGSKKKTKKYIVKDADKKIIKKGEIKNEKTFKLEIDELEPGEYYIIIDGYAEKIIIK